jgi:hypothetical protein
MTKEVASKTEREKRDTQLELKNPTIAQKIYDCISPLTHLVEVAIVVFEHQIVWSGKGTNRRETEMILVDVLPRVLQKRISLHSHPFFLFVDKGDLVHLLRGVVGKNLAELPSAIAWSKNWDVVLDEALIAYATRSVGITIREVSPGLVVDLVKTVVEW